MNILVIGSEGTVGKPLCDELERRGARVYRADLQHRQHSDYQRCDISEYRQCERLFEAQSFDYVYLLAAEFGRINGAEYYEKVWKTNVIGTRNILELQKKHGFKLIFTSSSEIYGEVNSSFLFEELSEKEPLRQSNDYAISKWVNEQQIMNAEAQAGSPIMRIRLFNAYGPGEEYHRYRSVVCLFTYRALNQMPYQVFKNYHRVFMYISDLIPTLANACVNFNPGKVYNIGGTEYCSVEEMSNIILDNLPTRDREAMRGLIEYLPEDKHNVVSKRPLIAKAAEDLGHDPKITLMEGIPKTMEWMRGFYGLGRIKAIA